MLKKLLVAGFALILGSAGTRAENIRLSPRGSNNTRETVGIDGDFLLTGSGYVAIGTFKRLDDAASAASSSRAGRAGRYLRRCAEPQIDRAHRHGNEGSEKCKGLHYGSYRSLCLEGK